jgi:hypothetical protein
MSTIRMKKYEALVLIVILIVLVLELSSPICAHLRVISSSARGGIRTRTVLVLSEAPPANWATLARVILGGLEPPFHCL